MNCRGQLMDSLNTLLINTGEENIAEFSLTHIDWLIKQIPETFYCALVGLDYDRELYLKLTNYDVRLYLCLEYPNQIHWLIIYKTGCVKNKGIITFENNEVETMGELYKDVESAIMAVSEVKGSN